MNKILDAAIAYARKGRPVFPCHPGKKNPATPQGFKDATKDEAIIRKWWAEIPDANLAMPTGTASGVIVLDIDCDADKDGEATLSALVAEHGPIPETLTIRTPRGGRHLFFNHPGGTVPSRTAHPGPALDIRADGGYVLLPPSRTDRGAYTVEVRAAIADCPGWLLELIRADRATAAPMKPEATRPGLPVPLPAAEDEESKIRSALDCIPASVSYGEWLNIGMALHWWNPSRGLALWDDWSRGCREKYKDGEPGKKWATFKNDRAATVGLGTLFEIAARYGWIHPAHVAKVQGRPADPSRRDDDGEAPAPTLEPVLEYQPFPVHALPEPHRGLVMAGADAIGCDPALVALPLLAATAGIIGNARRIEIKRSWKEPSVLWAVTVAMSGDRKSPAFELGTEALARIEDAAFAEWQGSREIYRAELEAWERGGREGQKPKEPEPERFIIRDVSIEAMAPILEANHRGVTVARDELAAWLGGFDRYKGGKGEESAQWLEVFGARRITVDRKSKERPVIHVPRAAVSITGTIQPGTLARVLSHRHIENGLAARILFAMPPRTLRTWTEDDIDPAILEPVRELFQRLRFLSEGTDGFGNPTPIDLPMTPEAKARWIEFYNRHGTEAHAIPDERLAAAWSKLEGITARLALIVHCIRVAARDGQVDPAAVDVASLAAAIELITWFKHEARRIYARLSETSEVREARKLHAFILDRGGRATIRDIQKGGLGIEDGRLEAVIEYAIRAALVRWEDSEPGKRGRPTRYLVADPSFRNPKSENTGEGSGVNEGSHSEIRKSENTQKGANHPKSEIQKSENTPEGTPDPYFRISDFRKQNANRPDGDFRISDFGMGSETEQGEV